MAQLTYKAGTSSASPYTVPDGKIVLAFLFISNAGGTLTITPGGAGNAPSAGDSIPLLAGVGFGRDYRANGPQDEPFPMLGAGTVFTFMGVDSFYVELGGAS